MCEYSYASVQSCGFVFFFSPSLFIGTSLSPEYSYAFFSFCICTETLSRGLCVSSYAGFFFSPSLFIGTSLSHEYSYADFFFLSNCTATLNRECSYGSFPLSVQQYSAVSTVLKKKKLYSNTEL